MKYLLLLSLLINNGLSQIPESFVNVKDEIPDILVDLRYYSEDNFVGQRVDAYEADILYLSKAATNALKAVQTELKKYQMRLKIFDAYRPQTAVNHFVRWAKDLDDTKTKAKYYPNESKSVLFKKGYIASKSGHSRGSTLDLTLVTIENGHFNELDMGTAWDFFSEKSATGYEFISLEQKKNRLLLKSIMEKYGFINYSKEWWHFTLKNEPFKNKYFDFIIK